MRIVSVLYFFLLAYIIASIFFWGRTLYKQNELIVKNEIAALNSDIDQVNNPVAFRDAYNDIKERENSRKRQYLGEGVTFLAITLIAASVVYSAMRSNHLLSQQQSNFMLSITHELKSPIAAVKLNLQTMARRKLDEDTQNTLIHRSINEANRLDDLCNNLLLASQMESRHFKFEEGRVNISSVIEESVSVYEARSKHTFVSKIEEECFTSGDRLMWKLTINNLLENAVKYSPPDSKVSISLVKMEDELLLSVADEGQGISDEEKTKVFKKFYRVGNENSRKTKGTGLGLYLSSKIIQQYKGSISVRDNEPVGTVFEIAMPSN